MVEETREALREIIIHPGLKEQELFSSLDGNKFNWDKLFDFSIQKPAFDNRKCKYFASLRSPNTIDILSWFTVLELKKAIMAKRFSENFFFSGAEKTYWHTSQVMQVQMRPATLKQIMVFSHSYATSSFQQFDVCVNMAVYSLKWRRSSRPLLADQLLVNVDSAHKTGLKLILEINWIRVWPSLRAVWF